MDHILKSYGLPSAHAHEIVLNPKKNWKRFPHDMIDSTWKTKWSEIAETKSTLNYMEISKWNFRSPNNCWSSVRDNKRDVAKGIIKARILTGTYKTQSINNRFDSTKSAECKLCKEETEDYKHFLVNCKSLNPVRKIHHIRLKHLMIGNQINYDYIIESENDLLQLLFDSSTNRRIPKSQLVAKCIHGIERICKDWVICITYQESRITVK